MNNAEKRSFYLALFVGFVIAAIPTSLALTLTDRSVFTTVALGLLTFGYGAWAVGQALEWRSRRRNDNTAA